jgi:C-terminal processing protease CtpA/Prc
MSKVRKHKALILDLSGNGGGWITTVTRLVLNLFDHDVTIGNVKSRKEPSH